jgi:hypothetical protein
MKRSLSILMIISVLFILEMENSYAQLWKMSRFEASAGLGPSFFFGDIGGFSKGDNALGIKDVTFLQTRVNFNLNFKYRIIRDLNVRLSLTSGLLKATDIRGSNEGRDYASIINIFEPAIIGEYYFLKNRSESSWRFMRGRDKGLGGLMRSLDVYFLTGIGGLAYSSEGNEKLVRAGSTTKGFTAVIPVGFGANMVYSPNFNFGVELAGRYSFSDYIDGYTSQYSRSNDVYYFLNFTFTYKLRTGSNGLPTFRRR